MKLAAYRLGQTEGGTVHIVGPSDFIHNRLASSLAALIPDGFNFRLHTGNKQLIYSLLDSGAIDLAVTASMPDEHQYAFAHLLTERMMLVFAPALARAVGKPTKESLSQTPLIAYDEDLPLIRSIWLSFFRYHRILKQHLLSPICALLKTW